MRPTKLCTEGQSHTFVACEVLIKGPFPRLYLDVPRETFEGGTSLNQFSLSVMHVPIRRLKPTVPNGSHSSVPLGLRHAFASVFVLVCVYKL